jgi:hypothetical protein
MLQMMRTATARITALARMHPAPSARRSPYRSFLCHQDGKPFMVINAASLEHAQFIVAGFSTDHAWMLIEMAE